MAKTIRLVSGTDTLDLRSQFGDATDTLNDGREVPRFVLHALDGNSTALDPVLRGRPIEVDDAVAEELMTIPGLVFDETNVNDAAIDTFRRTLVRDTFGNLLDPRTGQVVAPAGVAGAEVTPPVPQPVAQGQPLTAEQVQNEVQRNLADAPTAEAATGTDAASVAQG